MKNTLSNFIWIVAGTLIVNIILLLGFSLIAYLTMADEGLVCLFGMGIHFLSSLFAGFIAGKKIGSKRFFVGIIAGSIYFLCIFCVSLCVGGALSLGNVMRTFIICALAGTIGAIL